MVVRFSRNEEVGMRDKTIPLREIRRAVADYMGSEGGSCCRQMEEHDEHEEILGKLLEVPRYKDLSGRNFAKFRTKKT